MASQTCEENQTIIHTESPNYDGKNVSIQDYAIDTLIKNVAIRIDSKNYETISNNDDKFNFHSQQPKFEEWYDPSIEFEKVFHCHYWDPNDLDRKGICLFS